METIPVWLLDDEYRDLLKVKKYLETQTKARVNIQDALRLVVARGLKDYYKDANEYLKKQANEKRQLGKKLKKGMEEK